MKKKKLSMWQFIIVELLLVFMLVSMFLPSFGVDRITMTSWNDEMSEYYGIMSEEDLFKIDEDNNQLMRDQSGISLDEAHLINYISRRVYYDVKKYPAKVDQLIKDIKTDTGLDVGAIPPIALMLAPDLDKINLPQEFNDTHYTENISLVSPVISSKKILMFIFYILTILMALFIPVCLAIKKMSRIIPLACVTLYGIAAAVLMFIIRGASSPIPVPVWKSILTPLTIFIIIAGFVLCAFGILCILLYLFTGKGSKAKKDAAVPVFGAEPAGAAPVFGAEPAGEVTGYDPYTGEPVYGAPPMPEPDMPPVFGAEPAGAAPVFGAEPAGEITGYDPYTGEPVYGAPPMPEPDMPPVFGAEPAGAAPVFGAESAGEVTGYDPYTGEPVYGAPPMPEPEIVPPPMPEPGIVPPPMPEPEIVPPAMPEPPVPEPEKEAATADTSKEEPEAEEDDTPMTEVWIEDPEKGQERKPAAEQRMGTVMAISGAVNGQGFRLPATNVITIGSSSKKASWLIKDKLVSGEHCQIRYNAETNVYIVTDMSRNGTFAGDDRLKKDEPTELKAGTVISLADGTNQIRLG